MKLDSKIYVAGHKGLVGSAIVRRLNFEGFSNIVVRTHNELDLTDQAQVRNFFQSERPEYVVLAAAKVGGIYANSSYPADFIYQNIMIEANVINSSYESRVKRLLFLGSTCIYPKFSKQPISEEELLTGRLEPTNEPYALAKITGIKMCEAYNAQHNTDFRSIMPTNLYGINDNFHPKNSHVVPALIQRFHQAKLNKERKVVVWGTGTPMREFLYIDDMAKASLFVLKLDKETYDSNMSEMVSHVNIGTGVEVSISELANIVKRIVGFEGDLVFDASKPDGSPRKLVDVSIMQNMGWTYTVELEDGIAKTYEWYLESLMS